tara:strand:- start:12 stop:362 length:351 start_codon:yes stop_codon:yes gene_type:complete
MNLNKKATQEAMKDFTDAMIAGQKEVSNEQIFNEFVDDTIQLIRASRPSRVKAFDAYIERKEMEVNEFEEGYYNFKKHILSSSISREEAYEKLEFMFDRLLEEKEDLQILKDYRID